MPTALLNCNDELLWKRIKAAAKLSDKNISDYIISVLRKEVAK